MEELDRPCILRAKGLEKTIGKHRIVKNVTFDIYKGEVFGFLGPNGAGKTTTIRMLVGLIKPTAGTIEISGFDLQRQYTHAMRFVGCIVENPEMYKFLTGRENLEQYARMLGDIDALRIREVAALVGLEQRLDNKVKTYSLGMRQRLGIAQALLARPHVLILDEPTNGLDPGGIRELREFVKHLSRVEGISVFISSHILSEIEMMCDRVAIIHEGEVLHTGAVHEVLNEAKPRTIWKVDHPEQAVELASQWFQQVATKQDQMFEDVDGKDAEPLVFVEDDTFICTADPATIPQLNRWFVANGIDVFAIERKTMTLEDLFIKVTSSYSGRKSGA